MKAELTNFRPKLTLNAMKVLERRYFRKDENQNAIETPEELFQRVAFAIAGVDEMYGKSTQEVEELTQKFYQVMSNLEFIPNSPTLMNAGRNLGQLSACFVIPIEDSMESIFDAVKATALIHRSGGGTGFDFSILRPRGSRVRSTDGVSSGPVSFMKVFNAATQEIKQGGKRRGANMGILRVDHPDILEFIKCKEDDNEITNFNISVALTYNFMNRLEQGQEYELMDSNTRKMNGTLDARKLFDLIVEKAWKNGEPGIIFIDRMNEFNPTPHLGKYESTNPCAEQVLPPYESCNLGSINLSKMVIQNNGKYEIDWEKLKTVVYTSVHFLDNVIDANKFPLKEIEEKTKLTRKIGLGVMGWADHLIQLGIPYNSSQAIKLAGEVISFILHEAQKMSQELAKGKGTFPAFKGSIYNAPNMPKLRNATLTTIAPTGTISIIAGCSSGIEPLFALAYTRHVMDNDKLVEVNPYFERIAKQRGFYSEELMRKIAESGSCQALKEVPGDVKEIFVTSHNISPEWHIKMQSVFQKFTDNAVSKTINFPNEASVEDVKRTYLLAYELGCKGVTIYRDKSRKEQVLNIPSKKERKSMLKISPRPRSQVTKGTTTKIATGCGNLYITINEDDNSLPFEVFMHMGKAGGCAASQLEAIGRLASLALRCGIEPKDIISQLRGIRCPSPSWEKGRGRIFSCADAIARAIERQLEMDSSKEIDFEDGIQQTDKDSNCVHKQSNNVVGVCPDCGGALWHEEGCVKCMGCGYTKC